jgi:hypothetical protein
MDDLDRIAIDHAVENLVSVTPDDLHADRMIGTLRGAEWILGDLFDCALNRAKDIARARWTSRHKVASDFF